MTTRAVNPSLLNRPATGGEDGMPEWAPWLFAGAILLALLLFFLLWLKDRKGSNDD